ncbi:MAG: HNH endonuclease [Arcobacter sp.]|nr:HNH endonuclease [Arcobacter sp.]
MVLDLQFIIFGSIIILSLVPLYIYREKVFKKFYKSNNDIKFFLENIAIYLSATYPKIPFRNNNFKKYTKENNMRTQEILIIEELVKQYVNYEYELKTQKSIPKEKLWSSYEKNSKLLKDNKLPIDWQQRKETACLRDNNKCNRCGTKIKSSNANILLAKQMKNGGGFNLENIVVLCPDCTKILKSSNLEKTSRDLNILDNLMKKVSN